MALPQEYLEYENGRKATEEYLSKNPKASWEELSKFAYGFSNSYLAGVSEAYYNYLNKRQEEGVTCPNCKFFHGCKEVSRCVNCGEPMPKQEKEMVNHPPHYTSHPSGVECIQITQHMNFCLGNAMKYIWRAGEKDKTTEIQDLEKAVWYLKQEIQRLKQSAFPVSCAPPESKEKST